MHFTANNEPRALDILGDLDPNIFNECKEKMRPVKKALKALGNSAHGMQADELAAHKRECILKIGKHIDDCLAEHRDPNKIKEWRSNLWYFVSKFTDDNASRLFKLYRSVKAKENGEESPGKLEKREKSSHKSHDDKKKEKKSRELKHKTDRDIHEKYKFEHDEAYGETFSNKRRLEREDGEIDDGKDYKRMSADSR